MRAGDTISKALELARLVLDDRRDVKLNHSHNYLSKKSKPKNQTKNFTKRAPPVPLPEDDKHKVLYTKPGHARSIEITVAPLDQRAGIFPQHNSKGSLANCLEVIKACGLDEFKLYFCSQSLLSQGFKPKTYSLTQQKFYEIGEQFLHLSHEAFKQMMGLRKEFRRDFKVFVKQRTINDNETETQVACMHNTLDLVQFIQIYKTDHNNKIKNLKHIMFDAGEPIVINESFIDRYNNFRQIAHIGSKGSSTNILSALERFDDGSVCWHVSRFNKDTGLEKASAVLKTNGEVRAVSEATGELENNLSSLNELQKLASRNLGADGIDPQTQEWTGAFDPSGCVSEDSDKYLIRREYKDAVRKQLFRVIDGASIPGLNPIFL